MRTDADIANKDNNPLAEAAKALGIDPATATTPAPRVPLEVRGIEDFLLWLDAVVHRLKSPLYVAVEEARMAKDGAKERFLDAIVRTAYGHAQIVEIRCKLLGRPVQLGGPWTTASAIDEFEKLKTWVSCPRPSERYYRARWYEKATGDLLSVKTMEEAKKRPSTKIKWKKEGVLLYEIESVCDYWKQYAHQIRGYEAKHLREDGENRRTS